MRLLSIRYRRIPPFVDLILQFLVPVIRVGACEEISACFVG